LIDEEEEYDLRSSTGHEKELRRNVVGKFAADVE
jgi:hypothetical protein